MAIVGGIGDTGWQVAPDVPVDPELPLPEVEPSLDPEEEPLPALPVSDEESLAVVPVLELEDDVLPALESEDDVPPELPALNEEVLAELPALVLEDDVLSELLAPLDELAVVPALLLAESALDEEELLVPLELLDVPKVPPVGPPVTVVDEEELLSPLEVLDVPKVPPVGPLVAAVDEEELVVPLEVLDVPKVPPVGPPFAAVAEVAPEESLPLELLEPDTPLALDEWLPPIDVDACPSPPKPPRLVPLQAASASEAPTSHFE